MKIVLIILLLLIPLNLSTKQYGLWKYDWRLNDLKRTELFDKNNLKTKCLFGHMYYTYEGTYFTIPVLDRHENMVRCH